MTNKTTITAQAATTMSRFDFIALFVVVITRRGSHLGPLKQRVKHSNGVYRVTSGSAGTVVYQTSDTSLLFDYIRRTQLGPIVRDAEDFRGLAYEAA
jgi:hypothetical protein